MARHLVRFLVVASLPSDLNSPPPPPQPNSDVTPPKPSISNAPPSTRLPPIRNRGPPRRRRRQQQSSRLREQLTVIQIERAVGAGSYRDSEAKEGQRQSILRGLTPDSNGAMESDLEMKLRETGEWLYNTTSQKFQANGKRILMFTIQWAIPLYVFLFLVASRSIKLPFDTPLLDDFLM